MRGGWRTLIIPALSPPASPPQLMSLPGILSLSLSLHPGELRAVGAYTHPLTDLLKGPLWKMGMDNNRSSFHPGIRDAVIIDII